MYRVDGRLWTAGDHIHCHGPMAEMTTVVTAVRCGNTGPCSASYGGFYGWPLGQDGTARWRTRSNIAATQETNKWLYTRQTPGACSGLLKCA